MPTTFRPYGPGRLLPLAPDMHEWLPEGHPAHHVSDLADEPDLTAFHTPYEGDGRRNAPYEPRMMVQMLPYGYATGVFPSRGIAGRPEEDAAFRVSGAGNLPGRRTLCGFRRGHLEDFSGLFVEVVRLWRWRGWRTGWDWRTSGSRRRTGRRCGRTQANARRRLRSDASEGAGIGAVPDRARGTDAREDERFGEAFRGDGLPEELRRRGDRPAAIRAAKGDLEAEQRGADDARGRGPGRERNPKGGRPCKRACGEPDGKTRSNLTDPDGATTGTGSEGFRQCRNAQVAVDGEHRLIVATEPTSNGSDQGAPVGLPDEVRDRFDAQPGTVPADAGHCSERDLSEPEVLGIDGYVATGREGKRSADGDAGRRPATHRMVEKPATPAGRKRYAQRKRPSEAPDGRIGEVLGFRRSGVRSPAKARGMEPDMSDAGHRAAAGAPGSVRAPARRRNIARITRIGGPVGSSGPFRVPRRSLRPSGIPIPVSVPASGPARSSARVPELTSYGAGS